MSCPLVSIVVITYNSASTILETLDSIKAQSYQNIELIISDDGSRDDTVLICRNWLEANKVRFINSELITVEKNTGVAPNCNRGVAKARGEWIKLIAGDDLILSDGLSHYVDYIGENPKAKIVFAKMQLFGANDEYTNEVRRQYENDIFPKFSLGQKEQLEEYMCNPFIPGPGIFYSRALYDELGGYDNKYAMCEEDPFFARILLKGYKFYYLQKDCIAYRISEKSLCRSSDGEFIHTMDKLRFWKDCRRWYFIRRGRIFRMINTSCWFYEYKARYTKKTLDVLKFHFWKFLDIY